MKSAKTVTGYFAELSKNLLFNVKEIIKIPKQNKQHQKKRLQVIDELILTETKYIT